jgi:ABC-type spermidine/putrescine transport system permease subunit I
MTTTIAPPVEAGGEPTGGRPTSSGTDTRRRLGRSARRIGSGWLSVSPPVLVVLIFVGIPVVTGIAFAVGYTGGPNAIATLLSTSVLQNDGSPTFDVFKSLFADSQFLSDLWVTIVVTVVTVVVITLVAWSIALYARLAGSRWSRIVTGVAIVPLFIPVVIGAYAIRKFYLSTGFWGSAGKLFGIDLPPLSYHTSGIIVGQIWTSLPFAVLLISSGLAAVPDALIDAARDAGAGMVRTVWSVMVPMCTVPTVIVATFTGVGVLGSFTVPFMIGPTSPTMLGVQLVTTYNSYQRPQQAQAMAVVLFVLAIAIGWGYVWANARQARSSAVMGS